MGTNHIQQLDLSVRRIATSLLALTLVFSFATPCFAGHVKARGRVWYKDIRRDYSYKTAPDPGNSGLAAAGYSNSYARGKEYWELTGSGYVLRNWTSSYSQGSKYGVIAEAWHSNFLGRGSGGGSGGGPLDPTIPGTSTYFEVKAQSLVGGGRRVDVSPDTFLAVRMSDLAIDDNDAVSELTYMIDGVSSSASLRVSRAGGALEVVPTYTGIFQNLNPRLEIGVDGIATVVFQNLTFQTGGSDFSETLISSSSRVGDAIPPENVIVGTLSAIGDPAWLAGQTFDYELRRGTDVTDLGTFHCDGSLNFAIPVTAVAGTYDLYVKGRPFLGKLTPNISVGTGTMTNVVLTSGDIDGDNAVTILDYSVLSDYFDKSNIDSDWGTAGSNGFAPRDADLDGDGAVSILDYSILSDAFDQSGD